MKKISNTWSVRDMITTVPVSYTHLITLNEEKLSPRKRKQHSYMVMQDVGHQLFTDSVWEECHIGIQKPDMAQVDYALNLLALK